MTSSSPMLDHARLIHDLCQGNPLNKMVEFLKEENVLISVGEFFGCPQPEEAILLSWCLVNSLSNANFTLSDLMEYFGKDINNASRFQAILRSLEKKDLLFSDKSAACADGLKAKFFLPDYVVAAAVNNEPAQLQSPPQNDFLSFLSACFRLVLMCKEFAIHADILLRQIKRLEMVHSHFPEIQKLQYAISDVQQRLFLYALLERRMQENENWIDLRDFLPYCCVNKVQASAALAAFQKGQWSLYQQELLELFDEDVTDELFLKPAPKLYDLILPEMANRNELQSELFRIIDPKDITTEELVYDEQEQSQAIRLKDALMPETFHTLQQALREIGTQPGICILLHGFPGTGKTASVMQWAKQSGRSIFQVEISQIRSKWMGESEKNIRKVFTHYEKLGRKLEHAPILLFNEADALFGKRFQAERLADQTHNAMQNILLQAMEDFKGILVATTNLPQQLDPAFDRRFLFKLFFGKPSSKVRLQMLQAAFPGVEAEWLEQFDQQYPLTGGQIRNIRQKLRIQQVLDSKLSVPDCLLQFAADESDLHRKDRTAVVGFQPFRKCS